MIEIKENVSLTGLSTMMTGGNARYVVYWDTAEDLKILVTEPQYVDIQTAGYKPVGEGSNLLFITDDYRGALLKCAAENVCKISEDEESVLFEVSAGLSLDELINRCCNSNLWGVENLSLIPGTVGAAAVQNVGAYGVEFKDVVVGVNCFDIKDVCRRYFDAEELNYGYRDSLFKHEGYKDRMVVTSVVVRLSKNPIPHLTYGNLAETVGTDKDNICKIRDAVVRLRNNKLPEVGIVGSAGSFFKNPIVSDKHFEEIVNCVTDRGLDASTMPVYDVLEGKKLSAAWLIDKAGWKGATIGHAGVWPSQPLVLVNIDGQASGAEIAGLASEICRDVKDKFSVTLEPEVEYL